MVVGSFLLRDDGWREVSAGERPEVRSARLVGIGEERVRVDAHFDIATIEEVRGARFAQSSYCARDVVTRWRQTEMRVASCEPVLLQRCSLKLAFNLERWTSKRLAGTGQEVRWLPLLYRCQIIFAYN